MARDKNFYRKPALQNASAEELAREGDGFALAREAGGETGRMPTAPVGPDPSIMNTTRHLLSGGRFQQNWSNTGLITANDDWSGVTSIQGFRGDGLAGGTNADPRLITSADSPGVIDVNANQTNPDVFGTGGVTEFHITDATIALTGSSTARAPYIVIYLNSTGSSNIRFQCNLRDIDASADNAAQQINIQYRTSAGVWTNVPGGYFADVTATGASGPVTAVNVVLPSDANNAAGLEYAS